MHKKIKKYLSKNKEKNISFVIFRTDRIGDTVLSIQVAEVLKKHYPYSKISFVVRNYTKSILENNPFVDETISLDDFSKKDFISFIKSKKFDMSISLFASKEAVFVPFFAKIPIRIGPMSKMRSILFNVGIRQKRSQSKKNEAEYNLDLLKAFDIYDFCYPKIYLTEQEKVFGHEYFSNLGINQNDKLVILHPGSGGSSKDWALDKYFILAKMLIEKNINVFVSGSKKELDLYKKYLDKNNIDKKCLMQQELDIRKFFCLINSSDIFVSNSTGPLHCAVALGVKTISFYPPLRVCKFLRLGPFASDMSRHFVFTPNLPECKKCSEKCEYFLCMDRISENIVLDKVLELLKS